ncbi:MAG: biopolymer transporter ExbD [Planctomycetota bacterium]
MRIRRHHHPSSGHINVTPLIDVVMCLIVFYLIVGRLATQHARPISLPSTGVGDSESKPRLVLNVARPEGEGQGVVLSLGDQPVTIGELVGQLKARLGEPPRGELAIRADRRLAWGSVQPVVEACRAAGLPGVKLVTEKGAAK